MTQTKAETDYSKTDIWLHPHEGAWLGVCHGQIVTMHNEEDGCWLAWINGEIVEDEDGAGVQERFKEKEVAAQVVVAMCKIMAESDDFDDDEDTGEDAE